MLLWSRAMNNFNDRISRALLCCLSLICALEFQTRRSLGQETLSLPYRTPYSEAKRVISTSFAPDVSMDQRRQAVLSAAEVGYGRRLADRLRNPVNVLAKTPGGLGLALRMTVDNRSVKKGALRAALVAGALDADPRFQVIALDQPVRDGSGRLITDRDILYRHRGTGALGRMEVKDVSVVSQKKKKNMQEYKRQIREMGLEQRKTGQRQAFVNRRTVIPELQEYAKQHQVTVYENVVTSDTNAARNGTTPVADVIDDIERSARLSFRIRATAAGFGVVMSAIETPRAFKAWRSYVQGDGSLSEAGYRTLSVAAGGSFASSGVASTIASRIVASSPWASRLGRLGKIARRAGMALSAGALGVRGYQWYSGEISTRQMTIETTAAAGGFAGAWAGAVAGGWAGAELGGFIGMFAGPKGASLGAAVGGLLGSVGGAIGGAWAGQTIVAKGVESIYSRLDEEQQDLLFAEFLRIYEAKSR